MNVISRESSAPGIPDSTRHDERPRERLLGRPDALDRPNATVLSCVGLALRLHGSQLLHGLSLHAAAGEWLALLGPNGAGKTTALRVIAGSLRSNRKVVVEGTVAVRGMSVFAMSKRELGRTIAVVPQSPVFPVGMTTCDYILLGRTPHLGLLAGPGSVDRLIVADLLKRLDLEPFADRAITSLSGGEKQRAVIARALAQEAPVLVLDEPTSALDVGHQQQVLELVDQLRVERGIVVVSAMHDLSLAGQYAHTLVLLDQGGVVLQGKPRDVLDPGPLGRLYDANLEALQLPSGHTAVLPVRDLG